MAAAPQDPGRDAPELPAAAPPDAPPARRPVRLPAALIAVRHGESTANARFETADPAGAPHLPEPIPCRDADVPLSGRGRRQSAALGRLLASLPVERRPQSVWCSPYARARETARIALGTARRLGMAEVPVRIDERLRDRDLGVLEMLTRAAIEAHHPAEAARRDRLGELYYRPPGGESWADVALRLRGLLRDLGEAEDGRRVLVVGHDVVVLMLRYVLGGQDEAALERMAATAGRVGNASVSEWRAEGGRLRLVRYDDVAHLDAGG